MVDSTVADIDPLETADRSRRCFESFVDQLPQGMPSICGALNAFLQDQQLDDRTMYAVELIFEELLTNIAKYAYQDSGSIRTRVDIGTEAVRLIFEDQGQAFDPTRQSPPPRPTSLQEAEPGGLGIQLVRKFASRLQYERVQATNRTVAEVAFS